MRAASTLRAQRWQWIEPDRTFNGHVIATPDGTRVLTTETDLATGMGLVGVRDASTLEKLDEWPTQGRDPHELLWLSSSGRARLAVANGGIATLAETGRAKHDLPAMDPSLVVLDGQQRRMRRPVAPSRRAPVHASPRAARRHPRHRTASGARRSRCARAGAGSRPLRWPRAHRDARAAEARRLRRQRGRHLRWLRRELSARQWRRALR